jgi:hypothetical protein
VIKFETPAPARLTKHFYLKKAADTGALYPNRGGTALTFQRFLQHMQQTQQNISPHVIAFCIEL